MSTPKWGWIWFRRGLKPAMVVLGPRFDSVHLHHISIRKNKAMKKMKLWQPWFFENSKLPVWLSKIAPVEVWAFSAAFWVWCRGEMSDKTKRHETVHYQQQLEMLFVAQWVCYGICWLIGFAKYRDGAKAYRQNPFEQEAYEIDDFEDGLETRRLYGWTKYKI